jgi:hypothetical protein
MRKDPTAMLRDYDSVLVSHFNNVGKLLGLTKKQAEKYETSKVIDVPGGSGFGHQSKAQPSPHSEEFRKVGNKLRLFIITPEMKEDILRGIPQFYAGGLIKRKAYSRGTGVASSLSDQTKEVLSNRKETVFGRTGKVLDTLRKVQY